MSHLSQGESMATDKVPRLSKTERLVMELLITSRAELYGLELVEKGGGKIARVPEGQP